MTFFAAKAPREDASKVICRQKRHQMRLQDLSQGSAANGADCASAASDSIQDPLKQWREMQVL